MLATLPSYAPYPTWLNPGDNAWQLTAATLVGLMSVPGLVVLYGGVMQKRWSVNSMMLAFVAFALVLIVWVLYASRWASATRGTASRTTATSFFGNFIGNRAPVLDHSRRQGQATIPPRDAGRPGTSRSRRSSTSSSSSRRSRRS